MAVPIVNFSNMNDFINMQDEDVLEWFPERKNKNLYGTIVKYINDDTNRIYIKGLKVGEEISWIGTVPLHYSKVIGYCYSESELYVGVRMAIWNYNSRNLEFGYNIDSSGMYRKKFDIDKLKYYNKIGSLLVYESEKYGNLLILTSIDDKKWNNDKYWLYEYPESWELIEKIQAKSIINKTIKLTDKYPNIEIYNVDNYYLQYYHENKKTNQGV